MSKNETTRLPAEFKIDPTPVSVRPGRGSAGGDCNDRITAVEKISIWPERQTREQTPNPSTRARISRDSSYLIFTK